MWLCETSNVNVDHQAESHQAEKHGCMRCMQAGAVAGKSTVCSSCRAKALSAAVQCWVRQSILPDDGRSQAGVQEAQGSQAAEEQWQLAIATGWNVDTTSV
jgi:hypothetical protein